MGYKSPWIFSANNYLQTGQIATIKPASVRDTGVSRHHWGPVKGLMNQPLGHHDSMILRGLRRALYWAPIIPSGVSHGNNVK